MIDQNTPEGIVEARLIAAVQTLRAIPSAGEDIQIDPAKLPPYVSDTLRAAFEDQTARRIAPTEEALADMRTAIGWLRYLDEGEGELVWLRADGQPWRYVSQKTGCVRPKAWARWKEAIAKVARRAKVKARPASPRAKATAQPKGGEGGAGTGLAPLPKDGEGTNASSTSLHIPDLRSPIHGGGTGAPGGV